jgi:hypothetical protein
MPHPVSQGGDETAGAGGDKKGLWTTVVAAAVLVG